MTLDPEGSIEKAITAAGCACGKPFIQHDRHMPVYVWNVLADLLNFEPVPEVAGRAAPADRIDWELLWRAMRLAASDWPLPMNPRDLRAAYNRLREDK